MEMKLPPISYSVTRSPQASAPRKVETAYMPSRVSPTQDRRSSAVGESMRISTPEQDSAAAAAEIPGV